MPEINSYIHIALWIIVLATLAAFCLNAVRTYLVTAIISAVLLIRGIACDIILSDGVPIYKTLILVFLVLSAMVTRDRKGASLPIRSQTSFTNIVHHMPTHSVN